MTDPLLKIKVIADTAAAKSGLKDLEGQAGTTGTSFSKLGVAGAAVGAAVVALGVKSVMAFEDLGLTVGKFADATGVSKEEASRLIEVTGDLGISTETVQSSFGKMSKQLGANADAFKQYGIEAVKGKNGQVDVNETFLHAVDVINGIQDPLKRAEASAKVFGKGYQQMSELLGESSSKIRTDLASVDAAKIFDDKKVQQARDLRNAFDDIKDAGENLLLTIGSALAPVISKLAPILAKVIDAAKPLAEAIGQLLGDALEKIGPIIEGLLPLIQKTAELLGALPEYIVKVKDAVDDWAHKTGIAYAVQDNMNASLENAAKWIKDTGASYDDMVKSVMSTANATREQAVAALAAQGVVQKLSDTQEHVGVTARDAADSAAQAGDSFERMGLAAGEANQHLADAKATTDAMNDAYSALIGKLDATEAWQHALEQVDLLKWKMADTNATSAEQEQQWIDTTRALADYTKNAANIPTEIKTDVYALLDQGNINAVELVLADLARTRSARINVSVGNSAALNDAVHNYGTGATGGIVTQPTMALIGEAGPEAVVPLNRMPGASPLPGGTGGSGNTINVYTGADPRQVISIIKQYTKNGGSL